MPASLIQRFEHFAAATPDAVALVFRETTLTYGELDALACAYSKRLAAMGVRPGDLVGVLADPGSEMVAALLGILKSRAGYLPLDPEYPPHRLSYLIEDADASALIVQSRFADRIPEAAPAVLPLEGVELERSPTTRGGKPEERGADDLLYVIYTSGSTGRPKGVRVESSSVANLLDAAGDFYKLTPDDVTLFSYSFTFDAAVLQIFAPLAYGARLVVAGAEERRDVGRLAQLADQHGTTVWDMVPAMLAQLVELPDLSDRCGSLRLVVAGADVLPPALAEQFRKALPSCALQNHYGPTEGTVTTTVWSCGSGEDSASVPIGFPIRGVSVHLLDPDGAPVPDGELGEIWIGGDGLAAGYHNRPELTAERFVADLSTAGGRRYRTGDLGRFRADGALEFHGRADRQLAVRGFRVEPGEIESALCADPSVQSAAVTVRSSAQDAVLVAYVSPAAGHRIDVPQLRERVAETLPEYMRPNLFVAMDKLPYGVSGKVNYQALPEPPSGRPELSAPYVPPAGVQEQAVAAIVVRVLKVEQVGRQDNFIELGAHSLLMTRVATQLREEFQVEVPVSVVFEQPTVAGLAHWLSTEGESSGPAVPGPVPVDRVGPVPLSLAQEQVWCLGKLAPESIAYSTQAYLDIRGSLSVSLLEDALSEVVRRHEVLRTAFVERDGKPQQVVREPFRMRVQVEDLSGEPEEIREILATDRMEEIISRPFDVGRPPLFRWMLFKLASDRHQLLLVEHHFIHDGWSFGILMEELQECYRAFSAGDEPNLTELPIQFADYAVWQRDWLNTDAAQQQLDFWQQKLAGAESLLPLPTDRPRPAVQSHHGDAVVVSLPRDVYGRLRQLAGVSGDTGYMVMTSVFTMLMHQYTGKEDVVVAISLANRRYEATEHLIGMLINGGLLRADLTGDPTFDELRKRVAAAALEIYRNQDYPFSKLVEHLNPERSLSYNPLYQVAFSYHDARVPRMSLGDAQVDINYTQNYSAKHDLDVIVIPRGEQLAADGEGDVAEGVTMEWIYSTDLFDRSTIVRMADEFVELCRRVGTAPDQKISQLAPAVEPAAQPAWNEEQTR
ncbi:amino acid adenylation domain-containing protein [Streptomyces sp. N2-109]|uniref:Amino acid adenylation domain-containing protein n=1 Tax=Streptomyces gossypii TaxID=2883101 RepID=A0ABT2JP42_9ACTN|nr:amino acid adenylation domain-containing protein [Streptomyces gossypii]MCT2589640.1 amino acid adenylation domain-containing protein [Streptomyces gossypii]